CFYSHKFRGFQSSSEVSWSTWNINPVDALPEIWGTGWADANPSYHHLKKPSIMRSALKYATQLLFFHGFNCKPVRLATRSRHHHEFEGGEALPRKSVHARKHGFNIC